MSGNVGVPGGNAPDPKLSSSGGAPSAASGQAGDPAKDPGTEPKKDVVAYDTHAKLLGEKKKLQDKLDALEAAEKIRNENELKAKGDVEKLLKLREDELAEKNKLLAARDEQFNTAVKLGAVTEALSGKLDPKYDKLLAPFLADVIIDPTTNRPDPTSVLKAAQAFQTTFPEVVTKGTGTKLPNGAPMPGGQSLSLDEWKKLPVKEMKARMKDVKLN